MGSSGSFRIHDFFNTQKLPTFYFGKNSSLSPLFAKKLLTKVTDICVSTEENIITLNLSGGAKLRINDLEKTTLELRNYQDNEPIVTPIGNEFSSNQLITLSSDGNWLASTEKGKLIVWDAKTGYPLTEEISFADHALDIQFSSDCEFVKVLTSKGLIISFAIQVKWEKKPDWLHFIGAALTGLKINEDGEIVRLTLAEMKYEREQFLRAIKQSKSNDHMTKYLRNKFSD